MGVIGILTIVFIVLKLVGVIDWSWWLVLLATLIEIGVIFVSFTLIGVIAFIKEIKK